MNKAKKQSGAQIRAKKNKGWLTSALAILFVIIMVILPVLSLGAQSALADNPLTTWWTPPKPLLFYSRDVKLAYDPIANSVSYAADSEAYGVATGSEINDWLDMNYLKLSTDTPNIDQWPDNAYDQFGTQYIVWGGRNTQTANMNIKFNKLTKGTNNVGIERDLTLELFGADKYTGAPKIAYSVQQNKLFMVFYQRGDGSSPGSGDENDNNNSPVFFTESADQGTTWSTPVQIGLLQGYSPALPSIVVDAQGNPHVFYGQMSPSNTKSWLYTTVRYGSNAWTTPQEITGGNRARIFRPQEVLAPDGDIWITAVTDPASGVSANKEVEVLRWNNQNGQWSQFLDVSQNHPGAGYSTIAVDENNKVWVIWTNTFGDTSIWSTLSTYTTDNGQSWHAVTQVLRNSDWNWKRSFVLSAVYAKKAIYLVTSGEWTDPNYTNGPTLFLQTIPDVATLDGPAPTPVPTTPTTPTTASAGGSNSNTPTPTLTSAPTGNPTSTSGTATPTTNNSTPGAVNKQATVTPSLTTTVATSTQTTIIAAATNTPTPPPTPTPTTNVIAIVPPTATSTLYPVNAGSGSGEAEVIQPPQTQTTKVPATTTIANTPTAKPSLPPQNATANAYAATQAAAALTPQIVQLPSSSSTGNVAAAVNGNNSGAWGLGPQVVLPTATFTPTPRPTATPTPRPTPTASRIVGSSANGKGNAAALTPAVTIIVVTATPDPNQQQQQQAGETQIQQQPEPQKVPPPLGAFWLLPVGLAAGAKGVLNIMTARAVAKAGIKAVGSGSGRKP